MRKVLFIIFFISILFSTLYECPAQKKLKKSGKYSITIHFANGSSSAKKEGKTAWLLKEKWGEIKPIVIDSQIIRNGSVCFKGDVWPLQESLIDGNEKLFTSGEYKIKVSSNNLFSFFYSKTDGGNFTEIFEEQPSESVYIQEYKRIVPKKDKIGPENELYLTLQNYQKLLALLKVRDIRAGEQAEKHIASITDSLKHLGNYLKLRSDQDCEGSLFEILISNTQLPGYSTNNQEPNLSQLGDDRLIFTQFGEEIFKNKIGQISLQPRSIATEEIFKLLDNKYLTLPLLKSRMVSTAFNSFKESPIMGTEGTAIDIAQKYILSKESVVDDETFYEASYFTTLNQKSLIGMEAPELPFEDINGKLHSLEECLGFYTIIYFYTDDCSRCAIETPKLVEFLDNYKYGPIALMTVYIGNDKLKWRDYLSNFNTINPFVERIDVADIKKETSALLDYGIVSTPNMFLLDKNGKIIGRKIKTSTIKEILESQENSRLQIVSYFDKIFVGNSVEQTKEIIDTLAKASKGDFYTDLICELYSYLSTSDNYNNQLGAEYLGREYICAQKEKWRNKRYAEDVCRAVKLFNLNKLGERATDVRLYDAAGNPQNLLNPIKKKQILFFYRPDCGICTESIGELKKLHKKYSKYVIFSTIYIGNDELEFKRYVVKNKLDFINLWDKDSSGGLKEKYDLEGTPKIYLLDENNVVIAKDITIYDLATLLDQLEEDKNKK